MTDTSRPCSVLGFAPTATPAGPFSVDDRVEARWKSDHGGWYRGKITKVNSDGTYAVQFDDGDFEPSEPLDWMMAELPLKVGEDTNVPLRSRWSTAAECILEPKYLGPIICTIICIVLLFIYTGLFGLFVILLICCWREPCKQIPGCCPGRTDLPGECGVHACNL